QPVGPGQQYEAGAHGPRRQLALVIGWPGLAPAGPRVPATGQVIGSQNGCPGAQQRAGVNQETGLLGESTRVFVPDQRIVPGGIEQCAGVIKGMENEDATEQSGSASQSALVFEQDDDTPA